MLNCGLILLQKNCLPSAGIILALLLWAEPERIIFANALPPADTPQRITASSQENLEKPAFEVFDFTFDRNALALGNLECTPPNAKPLEQDKERAIAPVAWFFNGKEIAAQRNKRFFKIPSLKGTSVIHCVYLELKNQGNKNPTIYAYKAKYLSQATPIFLQTNHDYVILSNTKLRSSKNTTRFTLNSANLEFKEVRCFVKFPWLTNDLFVPCFAVRQGTQPYHVEIHWDHKLGSLIRELTLGTQALDDPFIAHIGTVKVELYKNSNRINGVNIPENIFTTNLQFAIANNQPKILTFVEEEKYNAKTCLLVAFDPEGNFITVEKEEKISGIRRPTKTDKSLVKNWALDKIANYFSDKNSNEKSLLKDLISSTNSLIFVFSPVQQNLACSAVVSDGSLLVRASAHKGTSEGTFTQIMTELDAHKKYLFINSMQIQTMANSIANYTPWDSRQIDDIFSKKFIANLEIAKSLK